MYTEEEIKRLAYFLWVDEGRPQGKDLEHYMKAKQILEERDRSLMPRTREPASSGDEPDSPPK